MGSNLNKRIFVLGVLLVLSVAAICRAELMGTDRNGSHTFGERVNNDRLLYHVKNPTGKAGFLNIKYQSPSLANGPEITYVEVSVTGIYNETHAYISSGDIGKTSIVIVLAVLHKKSVFSYEASVYGI